MDLVEKRLRQAGWGKFIRNGRLISMHWSMWKPGWKAYPLTISQAEKWTPLWASEEHARKR